MLDFELEPTFKAEARILVAGVGTSGLHIVDYCIKQGLEQADFLAVDSCWHALQQTLAQKRILVGADVTRGFGTCGNVNLAAQALRGCDYQFDTLFAAYDVVFVVTGLGGGTGTVAAAVVAEAAKRQGPLSVIVAAKPFSFQQRTAVAEQALSSLKCAADALIVLENDKALQDEIAPRPVEEVLKRANGEIFHIIKSLSQLVTLRRSNVETQDIIRVDFNDIRTIMGASGQAHIGFGISSAVENRGVLAVEQALKEVVSGSLNISGARGLLVSFMASPNISIVDIECAIDRIVEEIGEHVETNIIYGVTTSTALEDLIEVMVIATGFSASQNAASPKEELIHEVPTKTPSLTPQSAGYEVYAQLYTNDPLEAPAVIRTSTTTSLMSGHEQTNTKSPLPSWMVYPRR